MTSKELQEHFKSNDTALTYETQAGGVTKRIAKRIIDEYLASNSVDHKAILEMPAEQVSLPRIL